MKRLITQLVLASLPLYLWIEASPTEKKTSVSETHPTIPVVGLDDLQELEISDAKTQRIYLIRHGESELNRANEEGIHLTSGKSLHAKLTEVGLKQAFELAQKLSTKITSDEKIDILSSAALRAQETARVIFEELKNSHFEIILGNSYEGLCELGMGDWEGKAKDQAFDEALTTWKKLSQAKKFTTPKVEGGESFRTVAQRALRNLKEISKEYMGKTIFIVSHFHTMNAIALELSGQVPLLSDDVNTHLPLLIFENCDLLELEIPLKRGIEKAKVKRQIRSEV